jgi:pimeloyl-ACP methyl ester carboxylesterase
VSVGQYALAISEAGAGEPLVLIPGFAHAAATWADAIPHLQAFRTIALDNRGVGASDRPSGRYTIPGMADDVARLLDALGIAAAHVYGESMGGMIGIELALRHPDRVRRLVLASTHCGGRHVRTSGAMTAIRLVVGRNLSAVAPGTAIGLVRPLLPAVVRSRLPVWAASSRTMLRTCAGLVSYATYDRLPDIRTPTLVIHGTRDPIIDVTNAHVLASRIPGARLDLVPDEGHRVFATDPAGVLRRIAAFLRGSDA